MTVYGIRYKKVDKNWDNYGESTDIVIAKSTAEAMNKFNQHNAGKIDCMIIEEIFDYWKCIRCWEVY